MMRMMKTLILINTAVEMIHEDYYLISNSQLVFVGFIQVCSKILKRVCCTFAIGSHAESFLVFLH